MKSVPLLQVYAVVALILTMMMNDSQGDDHLFDNIKFKLDDATIDPEKRSFWVLLSSLVLFVAWIIFLTYYLSRIIGPIVSFILNRYDLVVSLRDRVAYALKCPFP
ncbi:unnamed protein product [Strongylus vulgaris]|uniref:Uncharacterized protein n=1 Tax=Strongylus vulgaris TaxID=40348 RepID=A0A3P7IH28_STRVU|nr:unnamed protein product [Strongylus vulgaris]